MAIQAHVDVARAEKLSGPSSLFLLTIADSGERKSTCDGFFTKAIREYEAEQTEASKSGFMKHAVTLAAWESKYNGIKDSIRQFTKTGKSTSDQEAALQKLQENKPEPPRVPRIIYGDATPEALKYSLAKLWPSGAVVSSEAGVVFGSHGMGKDSAMRNLATLNQLWDGTDMPTERRSSECFVVKGARLTMALQVQESTLRAFLIQSGELARGSGFLARFLIAWPNSTQGTRHFTEAPEHWPHLEAFNRRISEILNLPVPIDNDGALQPVMLTMKPEAKQAWIDYHDAIEGELISGGELFDIRDVASKTADNAARLAALFQVFNHGGGAVGLDAFQSASRIAAWHLNEARRFFGGLALPQELADAARLDSWLLEYCRCKKTDQVPITKVQQFGPSGIRLKGAIDAAMEELEGLERSRRVRDGKRKIILINPMLLVGN
jgi:putative DNA primase/helicase